MAVLLMTRPHTAARRFLAMLPAALISELDVILSPLISIQTLEQEIKLNINEAVIFTSANGVLAAAETLSGVENPAFCLGERTTQKATEAGWNAKFCGKTADDLVASLMRRRPSNGLLHLRGQYSRGNIADRLTVAGLSCREQVIYDQPLRPLTNEALSALAVSSNVVVPLFSPRTARQFADLCPNSAPVHLIAMSKAISEPLKLLNYKSLQICRKPDGQAMVQLVCQVVQRLNRVESGKSAQ